MEIGNIIDVRVYEPVELGEEIPDTDTVEVFEPESPQEERVEQRI